MTGKNVSFLETNISGKDLSLFKGINFKLSARCVSTTHITAITDFLKVTPAESLNLYIQSLSTLLTQVVLQKSTEKVKRICSEMLIRRMSYVAQLHNKEICYNVHSY